MNKEKEQNVQAERNFKDTLFRKIFKEPKELLQLYNAVNGTDYSNVQDLEIVTLENAIYLNVKNDVACVIGYSLNLYEQQASVNPNMPMRYLQYVAREYEKLILNKTLYSSKLIKVPAPNFIVFYNGTTEQPERLEMKLSDAYETFTENPALELRVVQLNINIGYNKELMDKCQTLKEYAIYVQRVREYAKEKPLNQAVEQAVRECISEGVLTEFLSRYRAEAISMSIFEYDEEREKALIREAEREMGWNEGLKAGMEHGIKEGIEQGIREGKEQGIREGKEEGRVEGIKITIEACKSLNATREVVLDMIMDKYSIEQEKAEQYMQLYWLE